MFVLLALTACGGDPTIIDGSVNGESLGEVATAFWGGPFILFSNEDLDCMDVDFARRTYDQTTAPTDFDMVTLQFAFDSSDISEGVFSTEGSDAAVDAKTLIVAGGAFTELRDRTGSIEVGPVVEREPVEGSFQVEFEDDSGSYTADYFIAEWCTNLVR
ncbi:MAG: hypothetical protein VX899_21185 [Myxococcota bacterium]|nr:hypothetical protein [Myxococcota bacterium]